jgi:hypothetical protein
MMVMALAHIPSSEMTRKQIFLEVVTLFYFHSLDLGDHHHPFNVTSLPVDLTI